MPTYLGHYFPARGYAYTSELVMPQPDYDGWLQDASRMAHMQWLTKEFQLEASGTYEGIPWTHSATVAVPGRELLTKFTDLYELFLGGGSQLVGVLHSDTISAGPHTLLVDVWFGRTPFGSAQINKKQGSTTQFNIPFGAQVAGVSLASTEFDPDSTFGKELGSFSANSSDAPYSPGFSFSKKFRADSSSDHSDCNMTLTVSDWLTL